MLEAKKVSIIIPIYNAEKYLNECLDSVIGQTYKNIEVICVNDGSKDNSLAICEQYKNKDNRIKIIDKENGGVSSARNAALEMITGEFIGFLDSDDYYREDAIEVMMSNVNSDDIDIVYARIDTTNIDIGSLHAFSANEERYGDSEDAMMVALKKHAYGTMLWNKLFRTETIKRGNTIIHFNTSLKCGEDEVWLFEVLNNCNKVAYIADEIYFWRVNEESAYREKTIRDVNLDDLKAQLYLVSNNLCQSKRVKNTVLNTLNKKILEYMVRAYEQGNNHYYRIFKKYNMKVRKYFYCSRDVRILAKIKRMLIILLMNLHFPASCVAKLYSIR